jgi:hypothetical protein
VQRLRERFREASQEATLSANSLLLSQQRRTVIGNAPFHKASHRALPDLEQSASSGCPLCFLLWAAAPSEVRDLCDDIRRNHPDAQWLPCHLTVDSAIFHGSRSARRLLLEYKYQSILVDPRVYVLPLKRYFGLLENKGNQSSVHCPATYTIF